MEIVIVEEAESVAAPRWEETIPKGFSVRRMAEKDATLTVLRNASPPIDVLIAVQTRPKQFSQRWFEACFAAAPLLRAVRILGPWCDGDLRTPGPVEGVLTVHFREAELRLSDILAALEEGKGALARPQTALHLPVEPALPREGRKLRVGVALKGTLQLAAADAIAALGHTPELERDGESFGDVDVLLVDGDAVESEEEGLNGPPRLKLCGFSRSESGAVLAKTFSIGDLDAALQKLTAEEATPTFPSSR